MVELTQSAKQQLDNHFNGKGVSPIRVYMAPSCGGPRLALALDEKRDNDSVHEVSGYTFLVEEELLKSAGAITVDMTPYGFLVTSAADPGGNGGGRGCSSSGSGGCSSC